VVLQLNCVLGRHCYCHSLNLAIGDTIKQSKVCQNTFEIAFEITKLVKFSHKTNVLFDKIQLQCEEESNIGIHTFVQHVGLSDRTPLKVFSLTLIV